MLPVTGTLVRRARDLRAVLRSPMYAFSSSDLSESQLTPTLEVSNALSSISEQFLYARSLKTVKSLVLKDAKASLCLVPSEYRRAYRQLLLQETLLGVLASHEQVSVEAYSG